MYVMSRFVIISLVLLIAVNIQGYDLNYLSGPTNIVLDTTEDIEATCAGRKCIRKCCAKNEYMNVNSSCEIFDRTFDFANIVVYDDTDLDLIVEKTLSDIFYLVPGQFYEVLEKKVFENQSFSELAFIASDYEMNEHLSESGILYLEFPNSYNRWNPVYYFCVDYKLDENDEATPTFWSVVSNEGVAKSNDYFTAALIISCVFLLIVLLVYILLPELQNLVGLVLMAYVLSLMGAFLSLVSLQLGKFEREGCIGFTGSTYFFFLATFCWMNVMSYDIWWTFRGYAKARPIHRRGEKFKFGMYCIYAWGLPLAMTIMLVVIDQLDLSDKPWFVKPLIGDAGCFLEGGQKLVYLYIPMLILIVCNWFFFLMTAFNIWRLSRGTSAINSDAAGNPTAHRNQRNRLMIYLKLSVIMGINWILEVVSFFSPDLQIWKFTDGYNLLIGLAIFLIFVFKRKIYIKLCDRYLHSHKGFIGRHTHSSSSNTLESNLSQETPLQISTHPNGKPTERWRET